MTFRVLKHLPLRCRKAWKTRARPLDRYARHHALHLVHRPVSPNSLGSRRDSAENKQQQHPHQHPRAGVQCSQRRGQLFKSIGQAASSHQLSQVSITCCVAKDSSPTSTARRVSRVSNGGDDGRSVSSSSSTSSDDFTKTAATEQLAGREEDAAIEERSAACSSSVSPRRWWVFFFSLRRNTIVGWALRPYRALSSSSCLKRKS